MTQTMQALEIRRRVQVVDLAQYVRDNASAMDAAVRAWQAMPASDRRRVVAQVRRDFAAHRPMFGFKADATNLTTKHGAPSKSKKAKQAKLDKNRTVTLGLTIQSATLCRFDWQGRRVVLASCPHMGLCGRVCVLGHGRGEWDTVRSGRDWRSFLLWHDPVSFAIALRSELEASADEYGRILVRPNVNSDIPWHTVPALWEPTADGSEILAYGYTKDPSVLETDGYLLPTYRVTYSANERSDERAMARFLARGGTVAMVTNRRKGQPVADRVRVGRRWVPMVDGDETDDRWSDPRGVVVDLYAKGYAIGKSVGGFVRTVY